MSLFPGSDGNAFRSDAAFAETTAGQHARTGRLPRKRGQIEIAIDVAGICGSNISGFLGRIALR
jgi:hypothetical protein